MTTPTIPFLKWAGGKRWAIDRLNACLPKTFNRYFEPFLGGGALFFGIRPREPHLSDLNGRLIAAYEAIRDGWQEVETHIKWFHEHHRRDFYYQQRACTYDDRFLESARFIYLNRSCWNGLYRENMAGAFNVPIGTKQNIVLPTDNFKAIATALAPATLACLDFEEAINQAGDGDVVYADPPYTTAHNLNGFVKYNQKIFSWNDQLRLKEASKRAVLRGAHVLISNADHLSLRELYRDFSETLTLSRSSVIASQSERRGQIAELLVIGRPV